MNYLSLSRAARLAGVTRAELQRRIRRGDVETFEGAVAVHDLLRLYPAVSLSDDEALERVERIKADALPRDFQPDTVLPEPKVLVSRLKGLSETLSERLVALAATEGILDQVAERLEALATRPDGDGLKTGLEATRAWLAEARTALAATSGAARADSTERLRARLYAKDTYLRIMAATVKLIPSGHEFFVEGSESILEAAVRAGLKLSYGCANGNCGECKVRLAGGEVHKIRDHDYVMSERERGLGYLLACCHTAVTDVVLEAAEASSAADLPRQEIRASLRKLEAVGPDLVSLNVQTPRTKTLRFMAGQRARLTLEDGASAVLPIASCPCNGRSLWFYVRRGPEPFAAGVFAGLKHGEAILIEGPEGDFVLREDSPEPAVFLAVGDGIAPIKSLIEHAVSIDLIESFHLYWGTVHPEGHQYQGQWGRALKDSLDNFRFTPLLTDSPADLLAVVRSDLPNPAGLRWYLAGPAPAIEALRAGLVALGVPDARMALEATPT